MSRLRVLHVIPAVAPRYGGPSVAVTGICRALQAAGIPSVMATTDADGAGRLPVGIGQEVTHDGVVTRFFPRRGGESFKWSPPLATWLDQNVNTFDAVHVHAVFSHSSIAAGRACRRHGVPYVVRPLGTLDPWSLGRHAWRKRLLMRLAVRSMLVGASALHYTSAQERRLAETALTWLPRGTVVPLGVEDRWFSPAVTRNESTAPYVLSLSRLHPKKGIELLIDAFHQSSGAATGERWSLVIAGDGEPDYVQQLKTAASIGPAADRITFRGWVEGAEREALVREAHLVALPSHQENFGLAVVEALAAGVPVVVSPGVNLGGEIEAAGAGWVVARDRTVWRQALAAIMADEGGRRERGARARQFAEQFRWSRIADALRRMYLDVTNAPVSALRA